MFRRAVVVAIVVASLISAIPASAHTRHTYRASARVVPTPALLACIAHYESGGNPWPTRKSGYFGKYQITAKKVFYWFNGRDISQVTEAEQDEAVARYITLKGSIRAWPKPARLCR